MNGMILLCIVLLNLWLGTQVMAQPVVTRELAPQSVDLRRQVATLKALVYNPDARFSGSFIVVQLRDLAAFASKRIDSAADLRDTHLMIGNVEVKAA